MFRNFLKKREQKVFAESDFSPPYFYIGLYEEENRRAKVEHLTIKEIERITVEPGDLRLLQDALSRRDREYAYVRSLCESRPPGRSINRFQIL